MSQSDSMAEKHLNDTVRTLSFGTLWRMMRYPFVLLSTFVIPPLMGMETYGKYAAFISVMLIWDTFTWIGAAQIFGRFVPEFGPEDRDKATYLFHGVMYYGVLLSLIVIAVGYAFFRFFGLKGFDAAWFPALITVLLLAKVEGTLFGFAYGMNRIGFFSAKETIRSAFTLIFVVVLYRAFGLVGALWGLAANEALLALVGGYGTRKHLFGKPRRIRMSELRPYLLFGMTFYVPCILFGLQQRSGNIFVLQLTGSTEQVSYYDIANQFLLLTGMYFRLFMSTLIPSLTVLHVKGDEETVRRWQHGAMVLCGVFVFLAYHALAVMGRGVLVLWLHSSGEEIYRNAMVIGLSLVPLVVSQVGMNLAILDKHPGVYAVSVLLGFVAMAVACVALVPAAQSTGASWATLIGYTVSALAFLPWYKGRLIGTLGGFGKLMLLGCLFAPLYLCRFSLVMSCVIFAVTSVIYVAAVFLLGIIRVAEVRNLVDAFRKGRRADKELATESVP